MKKNNLIYTYLLAVSFLFGMGACDTLDQEPVNQIPTDEAITNARSAERAILGMYDGMQSENYYGLRYLYYQDTYTDNLQHAGTFTTDQEVSFRRINPSNLQIRSTWQTMYRVIRDANFILFSLSNLEDATEEQLLAYEAEARFIRAYVYYDLLRVFNGVPLVTDFVTTVDEINTLPRASTEDLYAFIIAELQFAEQNLGETPDAPFRARPAAATAMLARVHLQAGNPGQAAQKATEAIGLGYSLLPNYRDIWTIPGNAEMIFNLSFTNVDGDQSALAISSDPATGGQKFYVREDFFNQFAASAAEGDTRFAASILPQGNVRRVNKYYRSGTNDDNAPLIRLAEMYLIRAEAIVRQGSVTAQVITDINTIRNRAGLVSLTGLASPAAALTEIQRQRRFELAFEGHRYSDMRRFGNIGTLFPDNEQFRVIWPIPLQEIEVNPNLEQNPGYTAE
ncbi:RagB/SusD family nutrient uptake outer membrane protein [Litoribacter alkaliphilus]|uniref:RagB/SusD family nutrient uptake outer membrane protein n=1 Tax=Litoribacter ruber TaxID=702568 RepID=A0AAP2CEC1_9BACT|nr:RagB/SusD family nutrient uptake outer membrane protein [Litoribacter alkaliphilus]MBS9522811.1 RagB/SusD family nutrient uptake outer membrane protein [Litoribacter alkaliphilus]